MLLGPKHQTYRFMTHKADAKIHAIGIFRVTFQKGQDGVRRCFTVTQLPRRPPVRRLAPSRMYANWNWTF